MIQTTLPKEVASRYANPYFFETGTANGACVELALSCGFEKIFSVEIEPERQSENIKKFTKEIVAHKVKLYTGDSLLLFPEMVKELDKPTTFWLDAHVDEGKSGVKKCPLYEELETIATSPIKIHTIMIDDISYFGTKNHWGDGISLETIKEKILQINPSYNFAFEDGHTPNDILVAHLQ
jgi:hypothetical protein